MSLIFPSIKAISFDLDDTLYDNKPVIKNAFLVLFEYLCGQYPAVEKRYDFETFLKSAKSCRQQNPNITNLDELRKIHIDSVIKHSTGSNNQQSLHLNTFELNSLHLNSFELNRAFSIFWEARQQVTLFPQTLELLKHLSRQLPLVSLSNGNVSPERIGIKKYFNESINLMDAGNAKPHPAMFHLACQRLNIKPQELLHIGDSLPIDIRGAQRAGCLALWFNPGAASASTGYSDFTDLEQTDFSLTKPDGEIQCLSELFEIKLS